MQQRLTDELVERLPDFGADVGFDGKALRSHSTGRRTARTGQPSDPDADWEMTLLLQYRPHRTRAKDDPTLPGETHPTRALNADVIDPLIYDERGIVSCRSPTDRPNSPDGLSRCRKDTSNSQVPLSSPLTTGSNVSAVTNATETPVPRIRAVEWYA